MNLRRKGKQIHFSTAVTKCFTDRWATGGPDTNVVGLLHRPIQAQVIGWFRLIVCCILGMVMEVLEDHIAFFGGLRS